MLLQEESSAAVMYWPPEMGTSMELGSMIISNKNYSAHSEKKNIHIRELELTIQDSNYVRSHSEKSLFNFFRICIWYLYLAKITIQLCH